jgi:hypothetical protein
MKKVIVLVLVLCSFLWCSVLLADEETSVRGEIKLGLADGYTDNGMPDGRRLKFPRLGVDSSVGISVVSKHIGYIYELYFTGTIYNFNDSSEDDYSLFQFGGRMGLGPTIKTNSRFSEMYFLPTWSLFSMSVDTDLGPAWNPQIGLSVKFGLVYLRAMFFGIVAKEEKGYGYVFAIGIVYPSEDIAE